MPLPLRLPSSLSRLWFFFACLSAVARRQKSASLLSAPARFAATWLPNSETPSWAASLECMRVSVRDELRNHTPHAIPLILAGRGTLLVVACLHRDP